ncbi:seed storage albumin 3 [Hibiscus trionum]|uniref:Seed storage albumin 3 n=1 Tax=Hibiscus trionum TaxID=183268 RepID=A0A9W7MMP9_HIBTR|nr:seed storage albumin 3 [Hibiscus trionum]
MAKLAAYLATFALILFVAHASITTVTVDEENPWGRPSRTESGCQEKIRKVDHLQACQKYLEEQLGGSSRYNKRWNLDSCCQQLEMLDNKCRCPGLRQAMKQMEMGQMETEDMQEMYEAAERILSKCDMQPRRCDFPSRHMV